MQTGLLARLWEAAVELQSVEAVMRLRLCFCTLS